MTPSSYRTTPHRHRRPTGRHRIDTVVLPDDTASTPSSYRTTPHRHRRPTGRHRIDTVVLPDDTASTPSSYRTTPHRHRRPTGRHRIDTVVLPDDTASTPSSYRTTPHRHRRPTGRHRIDTVVLPDDTASTPSSYRTTPHPRAVPRTVEPLRRSIAGAITSSSYRTTPHPGAVPRTVEPLRRSIAGAITSSSYRTTPHPGAVPRTVEPLRRSIAGASGPHSSRQSVGVLMAGSAGALLLPAERGDAQHQSGGAPQAEDQRDPAELPAARRLLSGQRFRQEHRPEPLRHPLEREERGDRLHPLRDLVEPEEDTGDELQDQGDRRHRRRCRPAVLRQARDGDAEQGAGSRTEQADPCEREPLGAGRQPDAVNQPAHQQQDDLDQHGHGEDLH